MIRFAVRWAARSIRAILWLLLFVAVIGVVALRYWIFPNVETYREDIARSISKAAGQRITIGKIVPGWIQLQPHLLLEHVTVYDHQQRPALVLENISGTVSWLSLLLGEVSLNTLALDAPVLTISRDRNGLIFAAGIAIDPRSKDSSFSDWLLRQRRITIRDAVILWRDDLRAAPPLVLHDLDFDLTNRRERHRFVLSAIPPPTLAKPLAISGNLSGKTLRDKSQWRGTLYASVQDTDITQWKQWLDLPIEVASGYGNLRVWLTLHPQQTRQIRMALSLRDAVVRIKPELPQLAMAGLSGIVDWHTDPTSDRIQFEQLAASTREGLVVQPFDLALKIERAAAGGKAARGSLSGSRLVLDRLHYFTRFFPLTPEFRNTLDQLRPHGLIDTLSAEWSGPWENPQTYSIDARFTQLAMAAYKKLPAFSNLSGTLTANEKKGSVGLIAVNTALSLPTVFAEAVPITKLSAQADWRWRQKLLELNLPRVQIDNPHLAGTVSAVYRQAPKGAGVINLDGKLSRADARYVYHYLPVTVGAVTRDWLRDSLKAGHSGDARVVLRGNLDDFPFDHGKPGTFRVTARFHDGVIDYAEGWPQFDKVTGELLFDAARMKIKVSSARIFRSTLANVEAVIPDLLHHDELLQISGVANAYTADMLQFIEQSSIKNRINNAAQGLKADGMGKLDLRLDMPLRRSVDTRVRGSYTFVDNTFKAEFLPALRHINGKLEFTENTVQARNINMEAIGGPVQMNITTVNDSVKIDAQGRFSATALREFGDSALLQRLRGGSDWRGALILRKNASSIAVESTLQGLQSAFPEPLAKRATDLAPLRFERQTSATGDVIGVSYNRNINAIIARRANAGRLDIERGHINFNGPAALPQQRGIALNAALRFIDVDAWRSALKADPTASGNAPTQNIANLVSSIDVRADLIDLFGKRMHEVKLDASPTPAGWRGQLTSREAAGELIWIAEGKGLLRAQLKHLMLPPDAPEAPKSAADISNASRDPLPALEIVAESFAYGEKKLGRLDLNATNQGRDWRIEKLSISNPDATVMMDGRWRDWLAQPKTDVNLQLDIKDAGRFLSRVGYANAIKRGTGKLSGQFSWLGGPAALNFETMSGNFTLLVENGQFLKADPGFGKLLGILSLQALPRRITLDFRDVFSEGFAFDSINGTMQMTHGVLVSNDFKMRGPAANISMSGGTNLVLETQNLNVRIVPVLGSSVAIASALLGGPVVGLGTLLVQKVLKDPIDQMAAFEYSISGTWDNPIIAKLNRRPEPTE